MKHAFLIMAHGSLPLLRVLLSMLDDERNDIFLHIDRKSNMLDGAEPLALSKARLFVFYIELQFHVNSPRQFTLSTCFKGQFFSI